MQNFHEHKLWQEAYVALMDIHEALGDIENSDQDKEVVEEVLESAQNVAALIADGLTRRDSRVTRELIFNAVGEVAKARTHLAVAWGRGILDDMKFKSLDDKYANLSSSLQSFR